MPIASMFLHTESAMRIRHATLADLPALTALEACCFPPAEAAGEEALRDRLTCYPDHFWLLCRGDDIVSFVDGMVTDEPDLHDAMYADASLHRPEGHWQMIFGVSTHPDSRRQGHAERVLRQVIADAREAGRAGLVLTCKDALVPFYAKLGFEDEGISASDHGGVRWHQMRLNLADSTGSYGS